MGFGRMVTGVKRVSKSFRKIIKLNATSDHRVVGEISLHQVRLLLMLSTSDKGLDDGFRNPGLAQAFRVLVV